MIKATMEIFATKKDLQQLFISIEETGPLSYGLFDKSALCIREFSSISSIPGLGNSVTGRQILDPYVLIVPQGIAFEIEQIVTASGKIRYLYDQKKNPESIFLRPGGEFPVKTLISGQIATISSNEKSLKLFNTVRYELTNSFERVNSYWVGSEALSKFRSGYRLTADYNAPQIYDLVES